MQLDILKTLEDAGAGFRSVIILTYTLDLHFFEQLVAPRLEAAGCSNVLILTDPHGYDNALLFGARSLGTIGTRYVCAPLIGTGHGIQHAKLLLLAGPARGCLLIGSGNLTAPGYGRNLELFTKYTVAFDASTGSLTGDTFPFSAVWQLLSPLRNDPLLPHSAKDQLDTLAEKVGWLGSFAPPTHDLFVWHSAEQPIFDRLQGIEAVDELQIISPFFDRSVIDSLVKHFRPGRLVIGVDAHTPNIDGARLAAECRSWGCELTLRAIEGKDKRRSLHAKAIIGIRTDGAWCMSGSANCTYPALRTARSGGGNLEIVTFLRSTDRKAFDQLWNDSAITWGERHPADIGAGSTPATDRNIGDNVGLRLLELSYQHGDLRGRFLSLSQPVASSLWHLELLKRKVRLEITSLEGGTFTVPVDPPLQGVDAARVCVLAGGEWLYSPYHWIDQPEQLARYGQRSYHTRVKESLKTFVGAGKLFEDLMNFLWEKVDPASVQEKGDVSRRSSAHRRLQTGDDDVDPPPASAFITDEILSEHLGRVIDDYAPHDRSTMSLRDLLSLALLRLTAETQSTISDTGDADERDEARDEELQIERETQQHKLLDYLSDYLRHYCHRYSKRLTDRDFVLKSGPDLLFDNLFTLGRVLLEFSDKVEEFTPEDLRKCVVQLLSSLLWPRGANLSGEAAWDILLPEYGADNLLALWDEINLSPLVMELVVQAWGTPPHWLTALRDPGQTQPFLKLQALIEQLELRLGRHFWTGMQQDEIPELDIWGFRRLSDLWPEGDRTYSPDTTLQCFDNLAHYLTPVEAKYEDLFKLWDLRSRNLMNSSEAQALVAKVERAGYLHELGMVKTLPAQSRIAPLKGAHTHCPLCGMALPKHVYLSIQRGDLQLCPSCKKAVIYWRPVLDS